MATTKFDIVLCKASEGWNGKDYWVQARAGAIPPQRPGEKPVVVLNMQKCLLTGSDLFYGIHSLYTTDMGKTWSVPVAQPALERVTLPDGNDRTHCDGWPAWHAATGKLLATGHTAYYTPANRIVPGYRPRQTWYSVYDAGTRTWATMETLEMPQEEKFFSAGAGCTQRVDLENGEILLPVYYGGHKGVRPASATVVRCGFDGQKLTYLGHGTELTIAVERGFGEPSLTRFQGRYFLTLRNDVACYVTTGADGLHFEAPIEWRFDDGQPLGCYNTQTHWAARPDALYLVYTRRGLNNDHVFRHRAPMMIGQVDPRRLCVIRGTECEVLPNRGARMGNHGVTYVGDNEIWVTDCEWMQPAGCEKYGSNNTVWAARLIFGS